MELQEIYRKVIDGDAPGVQAGVQAALNEGQTTEVILNQELIAAMEEVGRRFEEGDFYVPEMLIAARAMQSGLALLKPHLAEGDVKSAGKVAIGTVKGDLHDIGKNLVAMMLEGAGFEVQDLGTDVDAKTFIKAVEGGANVIGMSALLTTTMPSMKTTIEALKQAGVRDRAKVLIGGAPVTQQYADEIGADGYGQSATAAVQLARELTGR